MNVHLENARGWRRGKSARMTEGHVVVRGARQIKTVGVGELIRIAIGRGVPKDDAIALADVFAANRRVARRDPLMWVTARSTAGTLRSRARNKGLS